MANIIFFPFIVIVVKCIKNIANNFFRCNLSDSHKYINMAVFFNMFPHPGAKNTLNVILFLKMQKTVSLTHFQKPCKLYA